MSGVVFISVCLGFSLVPFAFLGGRVSHPQRVLIRPLQLSMGLSSPSRGKVVLDLETFLFPSTRGHPRRAVPGLGPAFPACFSLWVAFLPLLFLSPSRSSPWHISQNQSLPSSSSPWTLQRIRNCPQKAALGCHFCIHKVRSTPSSSCPLPPGSQKCPLLLILNPPAKTLPPCRRCITGVNGT